MSEILPEISLHPEQGESGASGKDGSAQLKYRAINCDTLSQALELFLYERPIFCNGFPYLNYSYDEKGFGIWEIIANYGFDDRESANPNDPEITFDTTGGTAKINYADDTVMIGKIPNAVIPDFKNGIGWDGEQFTGTEVREPGFRWTEKFDKPHNFVSRSYRRLIRNMTYTVNDRAFRDFSAGEVMFLGIQAQTGRDDKNNRIWEIRYSFEASPNIGGIVIGECEPVNKDGHDYQWIYAPLQDNEESKQTVRIPMAVVVNRVYRRTHFANLGIGVD